MNFTSRPRVSHRPEKGCLVFNSGDGVEVEIAEVKARLKSPGSMVTKLGKDVEDEAFDIRDILAITFILKDMNDTLKLFHALQKRGVILQDNTASHSITQTLFNNPEDMKEAVQRLMISLARGRGRSELPVVNINSLEQNWGRLTSYDADGVVLRTQCKNEVKFLWTPT